MKICPSNWEAVATMGPQNTGILAQMHADAVSSPAMTIVTAPYQVGSNVGYVAAWCSMVVANRQTEKTLTLEVVSRLAQSLDGMRPTYTVPMTMMPTSPSLVLS